MNTKTTKWLVLTAIGLFLFILLFERRTQETTTTPEKLSRLLPNLNPTLVPPPPPCWAQCGACAPTAWRGGRAV